MKMRTMALFAVVAVVGAAMAALAQDSRPAGERIRPGTMPGEADHHRLLEAMADMNLPAEKLAAVKDAVEAFRQAVEKWRSEHQSELEALRQKLQNMTPEERATIRQELEKLMAGRQEALESLRKKLAELLTPEQVERLMTVLRGMAPEGKGPLSRPLSRPASRPEAGARPLERLAAILDKIGATDDQKAKAREIMEQAWAQARTQGPMAGAKMLREAIEKIAAEVLTPEQGAKLKELWRQRPDSAPAAP